MALPEAIERSRILSNWIGDRVDDLELPHDPKIHVPAICFHIALTHHTAIVSLLEHGRSASALALLRPLMESYLRGAWVYHVADPADLDSFIRGKKGLKAHEIIAALESVEAFDQKRLSVIKTEIWSDLCDYTHCGGKTIFAHFAGNEIRPTYDEVWLSQALTSADGWALLSGLATVMLVNRMDLGLEFLEQSRALANSATV